jgi:hypothetical protein
MSRSSAGVQSAWFMQPSWLMCHDTGGHWQSHITRENATPEVLMKSAPQRNASTNLVDPDSKAEPVRVVLSGIEVRVGSFYELHVNDLWQKVLLRKVCAEHDIFVFMGGCRQNEVVSLTSACLQRLWDTHRLRFLKMPSLRTSPGVCASRPLPKTWQIKPRISRGRT